ncbi:MAG: HNH endonuclease, partial [Candidatus Pacebacteria bacterium]|nr:HNH endonuclease [Candidatus Paceibacterota bacterium]
MRGARLICETFHGPPPTEAHTVDHINRTRNDDSSANLRWATGTEQSLNREYKVAPSNAPTRRWREVTQMKLDGTVIAHHKNMKTAAAAVDRGNTSLANAFAQNKRLKDGSIQAFGYRWLDKEPVARKNEVPTQLPGEIWKTHDVRTDYEVSSYDRLRTEDRIVHDP